MSTIASLCLNRNELNYHHCPQDEPDNDNPHPSPTIQNISYHFNFKSSKKLAIFGALVLVGGGSVVVALIATSCLHPIPGINSVELYAFLTCGVLVIISGGSLILWNRLKAQQNKQQHISSMIKKLQQTVPPQAPAETNSEYQASSESEFQWNKKFIDNLETVRDWNKSETISKYYRDSGGQVEVVFLKNTADQAIHIHVFTSKTPQAEDAVTKAKRFQLQQTGYTPVNGDNDEDV